jgi:hypothetical protein
MHNVLGRLLPSKHTLNFPVTIILSLVNKKSQAVEIVEAWKFNFSLDKLANINKAYSKGSLEVRDVKEYFEELV